MAAFYNGVMKLFITSSSGCYVNRFYMRIKRFDHICSTDPIKYLKILKETDKITTY